MKTGRLSKTEWHFIEVNADKMTADEIAKALDRDPDPIVKHLQKIGKSGDNKKSFEIQAQYDIKSRPYWKELKLQFSEEELELFLYHWSQIVAQFRKDIQPTEELQVIDLIRFEILMNRALKEQQESMERVRILQAELDLEKTRDSDQQDKEMIYNIDRQIASFRAAKESLSREFKDLQTKKAGLYRDLKATREQRIQKLENNKQTLSSLVHKILRDPEFYENEGKELEKMRLAMMSEQQRLADYYKYDDGTIDRPLLNSETVFYSEEQ